MHKYIGRRESAPEERIGFNHNEAKNETKKEEKKAIDRKKM